jgi:hypothetical protein
MGGEGPSAAVEKMNKDKIELGIPTAEAFCHRLLTHDAECGKRTVASGCASNALGHACATFKFAEEVPTGDEFFEYMRTKHGLTLSRNVSDKYYLAFRYVFENYLRFEAYIASENSTAI